MVIRRNALSSLEYDPATSDAQRLTEAISWGKWSVSRSGGARLRPRKLAMAHRALRVGYVSADICQHTVGLFLKDVLTAHDPTRVEPYAYSAGRVQDGVTAVIRAACRFRDVVDLADKALAALIHADEIDVLVDLSGHTAGSRLTTFAYRPAPVMVSWLGYFATTGLQYLDAVLLDEWHAPSGAEAMFVEPIIRLPGGKFCYQSVQFAPASVSPPPCLERGHITFGSFNNTAKYNTLVFDLWARVLAAVPGSHLILKWRTFNDDLLRQTITKTFTDRGIAADRIELRGPSFHSELLKEYADIDIALDPFPFSGGLTTCEALWMGVPVVTWPQGRVVSRQTFAFLSAIGLPEFAATDAEDYLRIAVSLAGDLCRLERLRTDMRDRMRASPLMDVTGFTRQLEQTFIDLHQTVCQQENQAASAKTINP